MEKQDINALITQAKSSNKSKTIQKIVPVITKETEEVQFSFYLEKELLKKMKQEALNQDTSIKQLINNAIKKALKLI